MLCFCSCDLCTSLAPGIRDPLLPSLKSWKRLSFPGHNPVWMYPSSCPDWEWDSHLHGQWDLEQHSSVQGWVTHFYPHQKNIPEIIHTKLNEQHYLNFFLQLLLQTHSTIILQLNSAIIQARGSRRLLTHGTQHGIDKIFAAGVKVT